MKYVQFIFSTLAILFLSGNIIEAQPKVAPGPGYIPTDFRVTKFATNLNFPTSMVQWTTTSILVATNKPTTGGSFFSSTGELRRLQDSNNDGIAEGNTVLFSGLPGVITSVRVKGQLIFVTSSQRGSERISLLRKGATNTASFTLIGSIRFAFPSDWSHTTYAFAVRTTPGFTYYYDLFFNIGSRENFSRTTATVPVSGLISGNVKGDSIYKVKIHDLGSSVVVSDLTQIATGLRNAAGMAFEPATGNLYFQDNGIDGTIDSTEPVSVDELNILKASAIGGTVENFGFPNDYIQYRTRTRKGSGGIQPFNTFQPTPNPASGSESEGPVEIAFVPPNFPTSLRNGIFIGFHGQGSKAGLSNEENPVLHCNNATKAYYQFIRNDETSVGHLDWLLTTVDALFLGDLSTKGTFNSGDKGVIYKIKYP